MEIQTTNEDKSVMEWEKIVPERYKLMLKLEKQPILNMIPNTPFISFNPPSYEGYQYFNVQYRQYSEIEKKKKVEGERLLYNNTSTTGQIVAYILSSHGFVETEGNCNVLWSGGHIKSVIMKRMKLKPYQKINHFPRTFEVTRKDRMYENIVRMAKTYGTQHFNFVPETYSLPAQYNEAMAAVKNSPEASWIIKPTSSSRGRGVFLLDTRKTLNSEKKCVLCRYIDNPYLVNGYKFDLRIYVLITSFEPLIIYQYEEGLARFATEKYKSARTTVNRFVHLTNYSVNKLNDKFVQNTNDAEDNTGHKWSLAALKEYFIANNVDVDTVMARIHDVVIKTFMSIKPAVSEYTFRYTPFRGNSFELFGLDILLDENLKPWLLEVNLSPSLTCDSPLDYKIKSSLVCDLLNMVGVSPFTLECSDYEEKLDKWVVENPGKKEDVLRIITEEYNRRGKWNRVYPSKNCADYSQFAEMRTSLNSFICESLSNSK